MNVLCVVAFLLCFVFKVKESRGDTNSRISQPNPSNSTFVFPSSFSMTIDLYYNSNSSKKTLSSSIWMDREKLVIRIDSYGGILKSFIEKIGEKISFYDVYPVAINSEDVCYKMTLPKDNSIYFSPLDEFFESNFKYIGKEMVRGIETDKWHYETLSSTAYTRFQKSTNDSTKQVITPVSLILTTPSLTQRFEVTSFSEGNLPAGIFKDPLDKLQCVERGPMNKIYDKLKETCVEVHEEKFSVSSDKLPEYFDWRESGAVNEIKDHCDREMSWSCAVTAVVEGAYFLRTNRTNLLRLSKQVLMDCSVAYKRGLEIDPRFGENYAYEWMIYNKGMPEETHYPGPNTGLHESCKIQNTSKLMTAAISGWGRVPAENINSLKSALLRHGPLAVRLEADISSMSKHSDEIYTNPTCGDTDYILPYSGLLVGFGRENNSEYWIVNPFWDNSIGQQGYFKIAIENNVCGVMDKATFVTF